MNRSLPFILSVALTTALVSFAPASDASAEEDEHRQRVDEKLASVTKMVQSLPSDATARDWSSLGDAQLRAGKCKQAVVSFEKAIELEPASEPYLWQYGIALFFIDRHDDGKQLFEKHRVVNANDVENAAWHFLCVAKASDVQQARKILLPAPGDPRIPMKQILDRLASEDDSEIKNAMKATDNPSAKFYGNLYLGLIADAEGRDENALRFMKESAKTDATHYMADVARVYRDHLVSRARTSETKSVK